MRRPIRTHRLSIIAIEWFAVFMVVAGAGMRSFWIWSALGNGNDRAVFLVDGYILFMHTSGSGGDPYPSGYESEKAQADSSLPRGFLGFAIKTETTSDIFTHLTGKQFSLRVPLWFPLLLLLINPARWLIARPLSGPAFSVSPIPSRDSS